jgi:hypothetical protein
MYKTLLIAAFLAVAGFNAAIAATAEAVPMKRTALPSVTFDEVVKNIAVEITVCKRLHGVMTKIISATMRGNTLEVRGDTSFKPIDAYPMKVTPTSEQIKSLIGKPICDPS